MPNTASMPTRDNGSKTIQIRFLKDLSPRKAVVFILAFSLIVFLSLLWLIYLKPASEYSSSLIANLPFANAFFNSISATCLLLGYSAVRRKEYDRHLKWMFGALAASSLFLISYVVYHTFHGDTKFLGQGAIRPIYFTVLISHIVLSGVLVPLILSSFYLSLSGRFRAHRKVSRWTYPVWLYVSVTGVLIVIMLQLFNAS